MITRRGLFGILAGAVAAPVVVRSGLLMPVKALVMPESKYVVVTSVSADASFLNPTIITQETLRIMHKRMTSPSSIFGARAFMIGDTIRIEFPA